MLHCRVLDCEKKWLCSHPNRQVHSRARRGLPISIDVIALIEIQSALDVPVLVLFARTFCRV